MSAHVGCDHCGSMREMPDELAGWFAVQPVGIPEQTIFCGSTCLAASHIPDGILCAGGDVILDVLSVLDKVGSAATVRASESLRQEIMVQHNYG